MLVSPRYGTILTDKNSFVFTTYLMDDREDAAKIRVLQFKSDGMFLKELYLDSPFKKLDTIWLDFIDDSGNFWGKALLDRERSEET